MGFLNKFKNSKLMKINYMPIVIAIFITLLIEILLGLIGFPKVWRLGLLFGLVNFFLAFFIGKYIAQKKISLVWSLLFPLVFAGLIFVHYASYNYFFAGIYLVISLLGYYQERSIIYR